IISPIISETANMNYIINNEAMVSSLWDLANDSIAERNQAKPEIFEPKLAEKWELSDDKLVYTIYLRKGIFWHDFKHPKTNKIFKNVEVTSADFEFYINVVKNEDVDCAPARSYLKDLKKIQVIDNYTFKVFWEKPYFLSESITLGLSPIPKHYYYYYKGTFDGKRFNDDYQINRKIIGCGPYKFVKWDKGQQIIMERWEKYWGKKYGIATPIKKRIFKVVKQPTTQFQSLLAGKLDRMGMTPQLWAERTDIPEFDTENDKFLIKKFRYPSRGYSYIGYNQTKEMFKDKETRLALTHLVDRKRILKEVYFDLGRIVTGSFFVDSPYYDKSIKPYEYSLEKAEKLLKKAGWADRDGDGILERNGKKFEFVFMSIANSPTQERLCPILKEDFAKAGIMMQIRPIEWSVYTERLKTKSFDVCCLGWSMGYESDPFQIWHSSQAKIKGSSNHIAFKNTKADELIEKIRVTFDLKKRINFCHQFHQLLHNQQPYTFLIARDSLVAQHKRYKNTPVYPLGMHTTSFWIPLEKQK
ncbi:MAG: ABC transporter substrate-binding protein, partial [Verrucomicrobiota bacterium]|nr:ABC transporter substrate-binding protein [Verrucomicrobiota bacterium]